MLRIVLFLPLAMFSLGSIQLLAQTASVLELDTPSVVEVVPPIVLEPGTASEFGTPTYLPGGAGIDWSTLGEDINKVHPALVVLQQELKTGIPLDIFKAYLMAQSNLVRDANVVAQAKIKNAEELQSVFDSLLNPNGLTEKQIESIGNYRGDLTDLIKEIARNRKADLGSIGIYKNLADSIDLYVLLEKCRDKDYDTFLDELEGSLFDYASAHRDMEYREVLGNNVARLKAIGEANGSASSARFIAAIDSLTRRPNVMLSVSERAINALVKSSDFGEINQPCMPVDECVLGTRILGTADTVGALRIDLRSAFNCAALDLYFNGEVTTTSTGYRKPVEIKSISRAPFTALTQICFNNYGLNWSKPTASVTTNTTICSIDKVGVQIFSGLIERIAWRQAHKQKSKAEAIGSETAARRLESEFNDRLTEPLTKAREFIQTKFQPLSKVLGGLDFNSTENELRVVATYSRLAQITVPLDLPAPAPHCQLPKGMTTSGDVVIQIHQTILDQIQRRKLEDETAEQKLAVSVAILDRLVDEVFSNDQGSSDSKLFELVFKSLRKTSTSGDGQGDTLGTKVFKKLGNLQFKMPVYDQETEWFTIHGYVKN